VVLSNDVQEVKCGGGGGIRTPVMKRKPMRRYTCFASFKFSEYPLAEAALGVPMFLLSVLQNRQKQRLN